MTAPTTRDQEVYYPESDGEPMAETGWHRAQMNHLIEAIRFFLHDDLDVTVGGNELFYYVEDDPARSCSPDVWVAWGLTRPGRERRIFKLWEEGKGPDLVIEVGSPSTRHRDRLEKKILYQDVFKVKEYVLFEVKVDDPAEHILSWDLTAFRLGEQDLYLPVLTTGGRFESVVLGTTLAFDGQRLRLLDPSDRPIPDTCLEGHALGRAEGLAEGMLEGKRDTLRHLIEARFGSPTAELAAFMAQLSHPREVDRLILRASTCTHPAQLMDA